MATDDDKVSIVLEGFSYQDWHEVSLDSDLFTAADAFTITGSIPPKDIRGAFREGVKCDIYVGRDRQMAGVIDDVEISIERGASKISVNGRDRAAFLVDCDAPKLRLENATIKTMTEALILPGFGIRNVIFSNEDNRSLLLGKRDKKKPKTGSGKVKAPAAPGSFVAASKSKPKTDKRKRIKVDPGQKIAAIIDTHTKRLGLTWWMTAEGDLFIGRPTYEQSAAYDFALYVNGSAKADENNVESASVKRTISDRYSEVSVTGVGVEHVSKFFVDAVSGGSAPPTPVTKRTPPQKFTAIAKDPDLQKRNITRKIINADGDVNNKAEAQRRANTEMQRGQLGALVISLTVPEYNQGGRLYAVDTTARVRIEEADIDGVYYVTARKFTENRGKRRTQLTLHERYVWLP